MIISWDVLDVYEQEARTSALNTYQISELDAAGLRLYEGPDGPQEVRRQGKRVGLHVHCVQIGLREVRFARLSQVLLEKLVL